jgi:hypothetical protein
VVGLATKKMDALYYLVGVFTGMFIFGETESLIHPLFVGGFLGNRVTLPGYFGLPTGVVAFVIILVALVGFWGAEWLERRYGEREG